MPRSKGPKTPPPMAPVVLRVPSEDFTFSEAQYAELEEAGGVALSSEQKSRLLTLAIFWIGDLRIRLSPRSKAFRKCLERIISTLSDAEEASRWDDPLRRHLLHWAMATDVEGAEALPGRLYGLEDNLKSAREFFAKLIQKLPSDPGRQRPFNDERRIIALADIFEAAGGKPVVYAAGYHEKGSMANTPFRRFAQLFYSVLPADDKRDPGGFDRAARCARYSARKTISVDPKGDFASQKNRGKLPFYFQFQICAECFPQRLERECVSIIATSKPDLEIELLVVKPSIA